MEVCLRFVVEVLVSCQSLFKGLGFSHSTQRWPPRMGSKPTKILFPGKTGVAWFE
jgi:hypothetical protein